MNPAESTRLGLNVVGPQAGGEAPTRNGSPTPRECARSQNKIFPKKSERLALPSKGAPAIPFSLAGQLAPSIDDL